MNLKSILALFVLFAISPLNAAENAEDIIRGWQAEAQKIANDVNELRHVWGIEDDGSIFAMDLTARALWKTHAQVVLNVDGKKQAYELNKGQRVEAPEGMARRFSPWPQKPEEWVIISIDRRRGTPDISYTASPGLPIDSIRLSHEGFPISADEKGYVVIPCREGLLIPADSGLEFTKSFGTYDYEGCHMAMIGLVKNGSAALITWDDPYTTIEVRSTLPEVLPKNWARG